MKIQELLELHANKCGNKIEDYHNTFIPFDIFTEELYEKLEEHFADYAVTSYKSFSIDHQVNDRSLKHLDPLKVGFIIGDTIEDVFIGICTNDYYTPLVKWNDDSIYFQTFADITSKDPLMGF